LEDPHHPLSLGLSLGVRGFEVDARFHGIENHLQTKSLRQEIYDLRDSRRKDPALLALEKPWDRFGEQLFQNEK
jgi:hypothetical protein